jgi:hypothetical protein
MKIRSIAIAIGAAGLLTACAHGYMDGPPSAYADLDYDGWYDGYYGPFNGGFWGPQGRFFYNDGQHFRPDMAGHFSHQGGAGMQHIQGHAPSAGHMAGGEMGGGHGGGGHGGRG